jgi:hypothetical protein
VEIKHEGMKNVEWRGDEDGHKCDRIRFDSGGPVLRRPSDPALSPLAERCQLQRVELVHRNTMRQSHTQTGHVLIHRGCALALCHLPELVTATNSNPLS